ALAEEHAHQRELLATLREELGTFAKECASALTALDAFIGLAGVAGILASDAKDALLVLQVGRRLGIPHEDATLESLYATLGAGPETARAGEAAGLASSLRDTVEHVEAALESVRRGKLQEVLAEMRRTLEAELDKLQGIHEGARDAPEDWREARRQEHAELR